jgi:hypothetical protein
MSGPTHGKSKYPCSRCGYLVFDDELGSYDICPICLWEDDYTQTIWPTSGGANRVPLIQAQKNYLAFEAKDARANTFARKPRPDEKRDDGWRAINPDKDLAMVDQELGFGPRPKAPIYYWRPRESKPTS